jgi:NitT/TauT family transport system substrate-binding protein
MIRFLKRLAVLISVLLICLGSSCRGPANKTPLRIALNIWPGYGAFFIAKDKGFYQQEGVDVQIEIIQGDPEREAALVANKIDGIGMTVDNLVLLRDKGVPVKAIYKYDGSNGADGIVAKKEIWSPADLKGKKVAWAPGTTSHFFLTQVLKDSGLTTKDLDHVAMSSDDAGAAFAAGKLDAAVTWEPWLSKAKENPNSKVLISTKEKPVIEDVLFIREEALNGRKEDVEKFLRACFKAIDYWKAHPSEGNEIIAKNLNLPIADVQNMLAGIKIMDYEDNRQFFGTASNPGPAYRAYTNAVEAWLKEGLIKKAGKPEDGIDPSFIANLRR